MQATYTPTRKEIEMESPDLSCNSHKSSERHTHALMKVNYYDKKAEIRLECYADTVVTEKDDKCIYIVAIRLGGYPESVKGMSDAIYGGGSIIIETEGKRRTISGKLKQYSREYSHDGLYAEAVLRVKDEEQRQLDSHDSDENPADNGIASPDEVLRKCYIFCSKDNETQLFAEVDKKVSVPLILEFQDYVLTEFCSRDILKPLQVVTATEDFDAWVLHISPSEENVISAINDGLHSGTISIPGASGKVFPTLHGVTQYLSTFGVAIAERIKDQFNPLFDPATESLTPEVLAVNKYIKENAGYSLYDAQLAVVEAHKRELKLSKSTLCIAECGSGKTKIGAAALHSYQQRLNYSVQDSFAGYNSRAHTKCFNIVMCPSHMAEKWVRELEETLPNTFAVIVTSITDLHTAYAAYERGNMTCYIIITKEKARDGYMRRPAVLWNMRRRAFICPDCYAEIEMDLIDSGSKYKVPTDHFFFRKESRNNRKCNDCGSLLWTALESDKQSEWVKVTDYGYIHRRFAYECLRLVAKKPKLYDIISAIAENPDGHFPNNRYYRRFPLSSYVKKKMTGKIDGLIIDELHNYNNDSGQGDAMGELFGTAKKVVGMTATLINGYSSGIFHLLYRMFPNLMLRDNKNYDKPTDFNAEYGVTESIYEIDAPDYNTNRRSVKRKIRERQLPGVSPLVYSRFLMDSAAFLSLNDMGKDLPEYEEIPIQLEMNEDVKKEYNRIEQKFIQIFKMQKDIAQKVLSAYLNLLTVYPDQPYGHGPVKHPILGDYLIVPEDVSSINELHEKDRRILDLVERKIDNGGRVLIYTSWTRIDTQEKLTKLLTEQGYHVAVLTASVSPKKREAWVERQVENGINVLITNPSLVETGLDLNDFTTLVFYNISYNLFTLRQSSRRSWRINQRAPRVEVYFFYYEGTMQHRAIRLMASKLAVAGVIEGNLSDEGLAAMSDCQDMTTALARELTHGIEGEVEDLSSVFKRMALLKPNADVIDVSADEITAVSDVSETETVFDASEGVTSNSVTAVQSTKRHTGQKAQPSGLLSLINTPKPKSFKKKKVYAALENQISLFDLLDNSA